MNGLFEILSNKEWMIQPEFLHSILPTLQYNITNHASLGIEREKRSPMAIGQQGLDFIREYQVTEDGNTLPAYDAWGEGDVLGKMKEPFVNVMPIDGPITRNGGACSYGSRDIRDWMMKAADNKFCRGHILYINTPGGSAWAKNDFQQAIDYAHARGQRVIAFIDGLCASAGMWIASLCDEVYVMNPKDQLGCVGVLAAFCTMKNGEKYQCGETYHEYYATKSINKNKEVRDIAENDDATELIAELDKLEAEFRADMKAAFPKATDEHLDGKVFDAKDVMGILCDGEMMLGEVISRVFNLADGSEQPIERTAGRKIGEPMQQAKTAKKTDNVLTQANNIMTEKYQTIAEMAGAVEGKFEKVDAEGVYMNTSLLDTLQSNIEAKNKEVADAKALVEQLTAEKDNLNAQIETIKTENAQAVENLKAEHQKAIEDLKAEHQKAIEDLKAEHQKAIEDLKAEHQKAIEDMNAAHATALNDKEKDFEDKLEEKNNQISALEQEKGDLQGEVNAKAESIEAMQTELNGAKGSLASAETIIAERDQQIAELQTEISALAGTPAPMTNGGANVPKGNATGATPKSNGIKSEVTADMTPEEIRQKLREQDEQAKTYRH